MKKIISIALLGIMLFNTGMNGMAAYNYHARVLGRIDPELDRFFCTALQAVGDPGQTTDALWPVSYTHLPWGSKSEPPVPPPMGRVVRLFLKVCSKPRNFRMP